MDKEEYYVVPAISTDYDDHPDGNPFCWDPTCGCHEDPTLIAEVNQAYQAGELTSQEATDFTRGKMF